MKLTVIVPTLDHGSGITRCLQSIRREFLGEIFVVDGGSRDDTVERALEHGVRVWHVAVGSGRNCNFKSQLELGANRASGDVLLFLSADCALPGGWLTALEKGLSDPAVVGGAFRLETEGFRSPRQWGSMLTCFAINFLNRFEFGFCFEPGLFVRADSLGKVPIGGAPAQKHRFPLDSEDGFTLLPLASRLSRGRNDR